MQAPTREAFRPYTDPAEFERIVDRETVVEMWKNCLAEFSDAPAVVDEGVTYTFAKLEADAAAFRALLGECKPGSRVAVLAANSYDFVKVYLAVVTAGLTAVILPAHLDAGAIYGCCRMFGAAALVYQPAFEDRMAVVRSQGPDIRLIAADTVSDAAAPMRECAGEDGCVIMFTGGTTGKSKGALLSHRAVMRGTVNGCYGVRNVFGQRYLLILPLSHVFGLIRNLMTSLYTGSCLFICRNNKDMFRDIAVFRPTVLVMVPALAEMALTLSRKFGRNMLGDDLKTVICGAAAVSPYLIEAYHETGVALLPGYGLTESANLVSGNPENLKKPDSVGIPYPHQELKLVDGELWIRGENMMDGYVGADEPDAWQDGWFRTGDLARFDEDGFLYITGRTKEIIVLPSGENVSPAEVEGHFNALPFIQDSQVFEDLNDAGAHILALEVVLRDTQMTAIEPSARAAYAVKQLEQVNRTLPAFQRVSRITVRETDFERTPAMKIVRYKKCQ